MRISQEIGNLMKEIETLVEEKTKESLDVSRLTREGERKEKRKGHVVRLHPAGQPQVGPAGIRAFPARQQDCQLRIALSIWRSRIPVSQKCEFSAPWRRL